MSDTTPEPERMSAEWNFHPEVPLQPIPYWTWPPRPIAVAKWLFENFLQFSDRAMYIVYGFIIAYWLMPIVPAQATFSWDWVGLVFLRNYIAVILVVGALHMWFYGIDGQGNLMRYDTRPINQKKNALYKFGNQVWDNMFYTLASGVVFASLWEIGARMAFAGGWGNTISFTSNPIWYLALFPILTMWQGIHFYFIHRLLHWPPLYRHVHSVHHRNVNTGPWSGLSMHPVEHAIYFSSFLIFFILPAHPVHLFFLMHWQMLGAPSSHSGYEAVFAKDKQRLLLGGFWHHLHHRYYECNYGNAEFPIDRWMGTNHDGTEEMTRITRDRKRKMHAKPK